VPPGEADFLVVLADDQVEINLHHLKKGGKLISSKNIDASKLPDPKTLNIALLGTLSSFVDIPQENWEDAIIKLLPSRFTDMNITAFRTGRNQ